MFHCCYNLETLDFGLKSDGNQFKEPKCLLIVLQQGFISIMTFSKLRSHLLRLRIFCSYEMYLIVLYVQHFTICNVLNLNTVSIINGHAHPFENLAVSVCLEDVWYANKYTKSPSEKVLTFCYVHGFSTLYFCQLCYIVEQMPPVNVTLSFSNWKQALWEVANWSTFKI